MVLGDIIKLLGNDWTAVEEKIRTALASDITLLQKMNESILQHGGKKLRPMLSLLMARACSGGRTTDDSICYAAASELLHNATLLHDDVADGSATRRGNPTAFALLGPSAAVLLGDFWLARAEDVLNSSERYPNVLPLFAKTINDLAEGEMLQLQKAGSADTDLDDYYRIIYSKTASLFVSACVSGALSVDAPESYKEAARKYARALGMAFQIKDDILDYDGSAELGKPVGVDIREGKITIPLLGALEGYDKASEVRNSVSRISENPEECDRIRNLVLERDGIGYAISKLDGFIDEAVDALSVLPESEEKKALEAIVRYNSYRRN